jgi:hypothetical protein
MNISHCGNDGLEMTLRVNRVNFAMSARCQLSPRERPHKRTCVLFGRSGCSASRLNHVSFSGRSWGNSGHEVELAKMSKMTHSVISRPLIAALRKIYSRSMLGFLSRFYRWRGRSTAGTILLQAFAIASQKRCFNHAGTPGASDSAPSSPGTVCRLKLSAQLIKPT